MYQHTTALQKAMLYIFTLPRAGPDPPGKRDWAHRRRGNLAPNPP